MESDTGFNSDIYVSRKAPELSTIIILNYQLTLLVAFRILIINSFTENGFRERTIILLK